SVHSRASAPPAGFRKDAPMITWLFAPSGLAGLRAGSRVHSDTEPAIASSPVGVRSVGGTSVTELHPAGFNRTGSSSRSRNAANHCSWVGSFTTFQLQKAAASHQSTFTTGWVRLIWRPCHWPPDRAAEYKVVQSSGSWPVFDAGCPGAS